MSAHTPGQTVKALPLGHAYEPPPAPRECVAWVKPADYPALPMYRCGKSEAEHQAQEPAKRPWGVTEEQAFQKSLRGTVERSAE